MIEYKLSLASSGAVKAPGYEDVLRFGYNKNCGVYRLRVTAADEWKGMKLRVFWHTPEGDPPASLVENGVVEVPAFVTAVSGEGRITFEGSDGTRTITSADMRYRVAANSGTEDGNYAAAGYACVAAAGGPGGRSRCRRPEKCRTGPEVDETGRKRKKRSGR